MDPLAIASNIARLAITICQALKEMKDLKTDATALSKLVRSVQNVIQNAAAELDGGQLRRPEAVNALQGVEESLTNCQQLVQKQAAKGKVVTFFSAGDYRADLKAATTSLANQLQALQMALGVEQHADLKQEFEQLRESMVALKLETLSSMEKQASEIRFTVEKWMRLVAAGGAASHQDDERLRRLLLECLEQAGVGAGGVAAAGGRRVFTQQEINEAVLEIRCEMVELRKSKNAHEAHYLAQIANILKPAAEDGSASAQNDRQQLKAPAASTAAPPPVPQTFLCPITLQVMRDPVILVDSGHSFERVAIERHLATSVTNPVTNLPLASSAVVSNHSLRGTIEEWLQQNGLTADQADNLPQPPPSDPVEIAASSMSRDTVAEITADVIWAGAHQTILKGQSGAVNCVAWSSCSSCGTLLASGDSANSVQLWDMPSSSGHTLRATLKGHDHPIYSVSWCPDGRSLASGSMDKSIRIWDTSSGECKAILKGHVKPILSVSWSPDGRSLASGSNDKSIRIWDASSGKCKATLEGHDGSTWSVSWNPDGRSLVSGSGDKSIRIWDMSSRMCKVTLKGHDDSVKSVSWSPDGRFLASGSSDKSIRIWDVSSSKCKATLEGHTDWVKCVSWSPDGKSLASGSDDKSIRIWDAFSGKCKATLKGHENIVGSVSWRRDGERLASGSWDRTIRIWEACSRP